VTNCYLCESCEQEVFRKRLRNNPQRNVLRRRSCALVWLDLKPAYLLVYYREQYRHQHSPAMGREICPGEAFRMHESFMAERIERVKPHVDREYRTLLGGHGKGESMALAHGNASPE